MIHTQVKHRKEDYLYIAKASRWSGENLVALGCIATPFLSPYFVAWKLSRRYKKSRSTQELFWGEEEVLSKTSREGIFEESHITYTVMNRYFEQNEAIYIRLKSEKAKLYLVVRDDGYLEGSKEELLELLEGKGILRG